MLLYIIFNYIHILYTIINIYICIYVCMYICIYVYMYVHMFFLHALRKSNMAIGHPRTSHGAFPGKSWWICNPSAPSATCLKTF